MIGCESSICRQFKPIYKTAINGKIIKSYYCYLEGRRIGCVDIKSIDNIEYKFNWFHEFKVFQVIESGDSVSKKQNSAYFEFYRKGKLLGTMDFSCSPPE